MKLRYITCSDPREDIPVQAMVDFAARYPISEFGIQAHSGPMSRGWPRNHWFDKIVNISKEMSNPLNLALHINYQWCDCMCCGVVPYELQDWIAMRNNKNGQPVIKRIQLNIGDNTYLFEPKFLANLIKQHPGQEFILPWNPGVEKRIEQLKNTGVKFSLLFDGSYGAGIEPEKWQKPVYRGVPNGYAGGLGADNVEKNLDKINQILPSNYTTWIDAEGRLRDKTTTGSFTLELAEKYVQNALRWVDQKHK